MPGPIVEVTLTFFIYVPLAPVGFACWMALTKAAMFSFNCSAEKLALPTPA